MPIVTITSDWSDSSYYLPILKGKVRSLFAGALANGLVDTNLVFEIISNSVKPFDIVQACFLLKNSFRSFPQGTIHLLAVNSEPTENIPMVVVKYAGQWIVSPNDGRFSLLLDSLAISKGMVTAYKMPLPDSFSTFMACDLFVKAIELISKKTIVEQLAVCQLKEVAAALPSITEDRITGRIIYIDSYGNAISNISKEIFAKAYVMWCSKANSEPDFTIYVMGPQLKIDEIYQSYNDVANGMNVVLFNSLGLLEFAINNGNFSEVESVGVNAEILIKLF